MYFKNQKGYKTKEFQLQVYQYWKRKIVEKLYRFLWPDSHVRLCSTVPVLLANGVRKISRKISNL